MGKREEGYPHKTNAWHVLFVLVVGGFAVYMLSLAQTADSESTTGLTFKIVDVDDKLVRLCETPTPLASTGCLLLKQNNFNRCDLMNLPQADCIELAGNIAFRGELTSVGPVTVDCMGFALNVHNVKEDVFLVNCP